MNWIEIVALFVLLAVMIAIGRRFSKPVLQIVYAMARLPCHKPRYRAGVAKLMPAILVEPMQHVRCTLWKRHDGPHEGTTMSGEVIRWHDEE